MKTTRKMLVRAFTKIAKGHWGDSKNTHMTLNRYGYKSPNQWGREMASMYFLNDKVMDNLMLAIIDESKMFSGVIGQDCIDYVAEEEISCL